jgi:hypothetical protein
LSVKESAIGGDDDAGVADAAASLVKDMADLTVF